VVHFRVLRLLEGRRHLWCPQGPLRRRLARNPPAPQLSLLPRLKRPKIANGSAPTTFMWTRLQAPGANPTLRWRITAAPPRCAPLAMSSCVGLGSTNPYACAGSCTPPRRSPPPSWARLGGSAQHWMTQPWPWAPTARLFTCRRPQLRPPGALFLFLPRIAPLCIW